MRIGQRLKQMRENMKLSQDDLAFSLNTTQKTISNWESDKGLPTLSQFVSIERILQVDVLSWFEENGIIFKNRNIKIDGEKILNNDFNKLIEQYEKRIADKDQVIEEQKEMIKNLLDKINPKY